MTESELIDRVTQELKALSTNFVDADYTNGVSSAVAETNFSLPNTNALQTLWLIQRSKRHMFFALYVQNSQKFKIKQFNLDQKFDHLGTLIKVMDEAYEKALESMDFITAGVSLEKLFGHQIDAGFAYDNVTGEDLTYSDDNVVIITPSDESV
jgi:hypothetical protein